MSEAELRNTNKATWTYSNDPNDYSATTGQKQMTGTTTVYTYGLEITKKFSKGADNIPDNFANVEFKLYEAVLPTPAPDAEGSPAPTAPSDVEKVDDDSPISFVTPESGSNYYAKADSSQNNTTTQITPDANGKFRLYGLEPGYYILHESSEPISGYANAEDIVIYVKANGSFEIQKLAESNAWEGSVSLKPNRKYELNGETTRTYIPEGGSEAVTEDVTHANADHEYLTFTVVNQKRFPLPSTGEMGVWLFGIGGVLLLAAAVFGYGSLKKKGKI